MPGVPLTCDNQNVLRHFARGTKALWIKNHVGRLLASLNFLILHLWSEKKNEPLHGKLFVNHMHQVPSTRPSGSWFLCALSPSCPPVPRGWAARFFKVGSGFGGFSRSYSETTQHVPLFMHALLTRPYLVSPGAQGRPGDHRKGAPGPTPVCRSLPKGLPARLPMSSTPRPACWPAWPRSPALSSPLCMTRESPLEQQEAAKPGHSAVLALPP